MARQNKSSRNLEWAGVPRDKALLLEVSSDWIKLIEISRVRGKLTLSRAHIEAVTGQTVVSESIRDAIARGKFSSSPVLACIPRQLVNVRLLELPSVQPSEIADMVELQIGRQTPYSLNEILSGCKSLGVVRQGTYTRVMLVIAQRSIVRERYYAIEAAGLSAERVTVSSEGVLNWFLYRTRAYTPETLSALLDVDSFFTHMIVVQHQKVVFTKSILWGAGQSAEGLDIFVQRVKEAFQSCGEALRGEKIVSVTVSGAGISLKGIDEVLSKELSISCRKADCLEDVVIDKGCEKVRDPLYATASLTALVGMALAPNLLDFNFVPDVVRLRGQIVWRARAWSAMAGLLLTAMVCMSLYGMLAAGYRLERRNRLKAEADGLENRMVRVERMLEVIRATQGRQDSRFLPERLLPVIHNCMPVNVYLDTLDIDEVRSRVTMSGTAPSRKDIRELIRMLEESPLFVGVEEGGRTAMDRDERFAFQVVGRFEEGPPK